VVSIGAYDGVHLGHRALIKRVREQARSLGLRSAVVTFDRHPATVVRPESAPRLLTDLDQKIELLADTALDEAVVVSFDAARSQETAEDFVREILVGCVSARSVVVGADFHFGHGRRGNVDLLRAMGVEVGFDVVAVDLVGGPDGAISSTRIRELLSNGRLGDAAGLLGRDYEVRGVVEPGEARGESLLGFPTANVTTPPEVLVPAEGIYAGYFTGQDGEEHKAAVYVGRVPTFHDDRSEPVLEAYLLDFSGDLYGDLARVRFVRRIRGDQRFDRVEDLVAQMGRDADTARAVLA
jgi:riboflavin kinase / FMN adenylyltransferase